MIKTSRAESSSRILCLSKQCIYVPCFYLIPLEWHTYLWLLHHLTDLLFLKCTFFCLTAKLLHEFQWECSYNPLLQGITNNCSLITVSTSDLTQSLVNRLPSWQNSGLFQWMSLLHDWAAPVCDLPAPLSSLLFQFYDALCAAFMLLEPNGAHQVFCFALW